MALRNHVEMQGHFCLWRFKAACDHNSELLQNNIDSNGERQWIDDKVELLLPAALNYKTEKLAEKLARKLVGKLVLLLLSMSSGHAYIWSRTTCAS